MQTPHTQPHQANNHAELGAIIVSTPVQSLGTGHISSNQDAVDPCTSQPPAYGPKSNQRKSTVIDVNDLSDDVLAAVLGKLTLASDITAVRLTCKRWRDVMDAWLPLLRKTVRGLRPALQRWPSLTRLAVKLRLKSNLNCNAPVCPLPLHLLQSCRHLTRLKIRGYSGNSLHSYSDMIKLLPPGQRIPQDVRDLAGCAQLKSLKLCKVDVTGLHCLSSLVHLHRLALLEMDLPDTDSISSLTSLRRLEIRDSHLQVVPNLADCTQITRLIISSCRLLPDGGRAHPPPRKTLMVYEESPAPSDVAPLACLTGLLELNLSHTGIQDIGPLSNCVQLQLLDLSETSVVDVQPLAACTRLTCLCLMSTEVEDLSPLGNCPALQVLNLQDECAVTDLSFLASCPMLSELDCRGCGYLQDISPLALCPALTSLDLSMTDVADISPLAACTALRSLNLIGCSVTAVSDLVACTALRFLKVSKSDLTGLSTLQEALPELVLMHVT